VASHPPPERTRSDLQEPSLFGRLGINAKTVIPALGDPNHIIDANRSRKLETDVNNLTLPRPNDSAVKKDMLLDNTIQRQKVDQMMPPPPSRQQNAEAQDDTGRICRRSMGSLLLPAPFSSLLTPDKNSARQRFATGEAAERGDDSDDDRDDKEEGPLIRPAMTGASWTLSRRIPGSNCTWCLRLTGDFGTADGESSRAVFFAEPSVGLVLEASIRLRLGDATSQASGVIPDRSSGEWEGMGKGKGNGACRTSGDAYRRADI